MKVRDAVASMMIPCIAEMEFNVFVRLVLMLCLAYPLPFGLQLFSLMTPPAAQLVFSGESLVRLFMTVFGLERGDVLDILQLPLLHVFCNSELYSDCMQLFTYHVGHTYLTTHDFFYSIDGKRLTECINRPNGLRHAACGNRLIIRQPTLGVLFHMSGDISAASHRQLYCQQCYATYSHGYFVRQSSRPQTLDDGSFGHKKMRVMQDSIGDVIRAGTHYFVEYKLARHMKNSLYRYKKGFDTFSRCWNDEFSPGAELYHIANLWSGVPLLSRKLCARLFAILVLWEYHIENNTAFVVLETGDDTMWDKPMREFLNEVKPKQGFHPHYCNYCFKKVYDDSGNVVGYVDAVSVDGLTALTHPVCSFSGCTSGIKHLSGVVFCDKHWSYHKQCRVMDVLEKHGKRNVSIGGCSAPVVDGHMTCHIHMHVERKYLNQKDSNWHFKLRRAGKKGVADRPIKPGTYKYFKLADGDLTYVVAFQRRMLNCIEMVVRPCGYIVNYAKMFTTESMTEVEKLLNDTFGDDPAGKPCYVIFDTSCRLWRTIITDAILFARWLFTVFVVDRFHQKHSHKVSDDFCQQRCSMDNYSNISGWFNSSRSESVNNQFHGYGTVCRTMTALHYDFFLTVMMLMHNVEVEKGLDDEGAEPRSDLFA